MTGWDGVTGLAGVLGLAGAEVEADGPVVVAVVALECPIARTAASAIRAAAATAPMTAIQMRDPDRPPPCWRGRPGGLLVGGLLVGGLLVGGLLVRGVVGGVLVRGVKLSAHFGVLLVLTQLLRVDNSTVA